MPRDTTKGPMAVLKEHATKALFQNRECLIAQFFKKHPDVDPVDVVLCSKMSVDGTRTFWIQRGRKRVRIGK
jgi:hypothetical protein